MRRVAALAVLTLSSALLPLSAAAEIALNKIERELPTFELPDLAGETWQAPMLVGKPYIVNFWASWCAPCVHELPAMNRAAEALLPEGVGMLAVNIGEGTVAVESFLNDIPIDFPVLLGNNLTLPNWKVRGLPTTYVIGGDGKIIGEAIGPREWDDAEFIEWMLTLR